jgi:hypothetical protein
MSVRVSSIQYRDLSLRDLFHHHAEGEIMGNDDKLDPVIAVRAVIRWLTRRCLLGWCDGAALGAAIAAASLRFDDRFAATVAAMDSPLTEALMFTGFLANFFGAIGFIVAFLHGAWKFDR